VGSEDDLNVAVAQRVPVSDQPSWGRRLAVYADDIGTLAFQTNPRGVGGNDYTIPDGSLLVSDQPSWGRRIARVRACVAIGHVSDQPSWGRRIPCDNTAGGVDTCFRPTLVGSEVVLSFGAVEIGSRFQTNPRGVGGY